MPVEIKGTEPGQRLDLFLSSRIPFSRSQIQVMISQGEILVNGLTVKKNYRLLGGENISVEEVEEEKIRAEAMDLDVIYEDDHLAVINKEAGVVMHPGSGQVSGTLVSGLLAKGWPLSDLGGLERPGIVHRLDKDTSGLVIIAKDNKTHSYLAEQFKKGQVKRIYWALVEGLPKWEEKTLEGFIERNPKQPTSYRMGSQGRFSRTYFKVLESFDSFTLLSCQLDTGRTHQIRVHLKSMNLPILGDRVYGSKKFKNRFSHQLLHSRQLEFLDIKGRFVSLEAPLPKEFQDFLNRQKTGLY